MCIIAKHLYKIVQTLISAHNQYILMTIILRVKYQIPWMKASLCIWFPHYSISNKNLDGH